MLRTARSIGVGVLTLIAALVIGLGSSVSTAVPASATTAGTDARPPSPMPLFGIVNPVVVGLHLIDALAGGLADLVEFVSTPEPVVIRAPQTT